MVRPAIAGDIVRHHGRSAINAGAGAGAGACLARMPVGAFIRALSGNRFRVKATSAHVLDIIRRESIERFRACAFLQLLFVDGFAIALSGLKSSLTV